MAEEYQTESIDITNGANFTYDTDIMKIDGGGNELTDQRLANSKLYCPYTSDQDDVWYGVSGTLAGGASVSAGVLNCDSGGNDACDYPSANVYVTNGILCARFKKIPQYSGSPAADRPILFVGKNGITVNYLYLQHDTSGNLQFTIRENGGSYVYNADTQFGAYSPTSGVAEIWELNVDLVTGAIRLFKDGTQMGATLTNTSSDFLVAQCDTIRLGNNVSKSLIPDDKFDDFVFFATVQHTSDHTGELPYSYSETLYSTSDDECSRNATLLLDGIQTFAATITKAGNDDVRLYQNVDGVKKYWNGAAWANSDGSYAQMNTLADVQANIATLDLSNGVYWKPGWRLHSDDGSTTPNISNITITYDFDHSPPTISRCIVYGTVKNSRGEGVEGATVKFTPTSNFYYSTTIIAQSSNVTTDSDGKYDIPIAENDTYGGTYEVDITYTESGQTETISYDAVSVPDQATIDQKTLLDP